MTDKSPNSPVESQTGPRIVVIGLGGAGGNAINNMIRRKLGGVEFLVANTDAQALEQSQCERQVQLGRNATRGLGAGSKSEVGRAAAEEALEEIRSEVKGAHMVFITAGMGGGTGTGAAPIVAQAAREAGILTVGVVTKPFHFEGTRRMRLAEAGIVELGKQVDTLIVIPNQNLFRVSDEKTTFSDAFRIADEVLHSGVRGVTDLMVMPGLINLDFADVKSVMAEMGNAIMGAGEAEGKNRALKAAKAAISNPLLGEVPMRDARGVLINIAGGMDLTLFEVDQAASRIREEVNAQANIIFGSVFDQRIEGRMRVSVFATGIDTEVRKERPKLVPLNFGRFNRGSAPAHPAGPRLVTVPARDSAKAAVDRPSEKNPRAGALQPETLKPDPSGHSENPPPIKPDKTINPSADRKPRRNGAANGAGSDKAHKASARTNGIKAAKAPSIGSKANGKGAPAHGSGKKIRRCRPMSGINENGQSRPGANGAAAAEPASEAKPEAGGRPRTNGANGFDVSARPKKQESAGTSMPRPEDPNATEPNAGGAKEGDKKGKGRKGRGVRRRS